MARKLSPEEATVMIIRRRLQQVEAAKKAEQKKDTHKRQSNTARRPDSPKSGQ